MIKCHSLKLRNSAVKKTLLRIWQATNWGGGGQIYVNNISDKRLDPDYIKNSQNSMKTKHIKQSKWFKQTLYQGRYTDGN